jgi:cytochrome c peroxidase
MRVGKTTLSTMWGVILGTSVVCSTSIAQSTGPITTNAIAGPLPPPKMPPNETKLTTVEQLGKFMLYDHTLSNPPGYSCATCHAPETGLLDLIPK